MAPDALPETRVLAIASHVVHGYVGNKMATCVLQALGCDVSAINTVHYSNHTAYRRITGTKTPPADLEALYMGLSQSNLHAFDVLLTGYVPSAEGVRAVGKIARDLKFNTRMREGGGRGVFWVLDPVMGDNGRLYIPQDEVGEYKALLREADLILPNQFEAETLSDTPITDLESLAKAIHTLHATYHVPHIIITSLRLTRDNQIPPTRPHTPTKDAEQGQPQDQAETLTIIGSTATSTHEPRLFRIDTPALPLFFSGTGDMFAALTIPRLLEAIALAPGEQNLRSAPSWRSPDHVAAEDLPLAHAVQRVCASMQAVLAKTLVRCEEGMRAYDERIERTGTAGSEQERHVELMKHSEVVVPRFVEDLRDPPELERFRARAVVVGAAVRGGEGSAGDGAGKSGSGSEGGKESGSGSASTQPQTSETQHQAAADASQAGQSVRD